MKKLVLNKEKLSKGERLNWKPLKEHNIAVSLTRDKITGKFVSEQEIKERQSFVGTQNNLLVP